MPHRCDAVEYGGLVFVAGMTAKNHGGPIGEQTRETLEKIDAILAQAGTDKSRLLSATIWLTDVADFKGMNEVWIDWLNPGEAPARACVGSVLAAEGLNVEIAVVAGK